MKSSLFCKYLLVHYDQYVFIFNLVAAEQRYDSYVFVFGTNDVPSREIDLQCNKRVLLGPRNVSNGGGWSILLWMANRR